MEIKERPIPLHQHEVKGILDERQTQIRRVIKSNWLDECWQFVEKDEDSFVFETEVDWNPTGRTQRGIKCPYGKPGDRLWVRETWAKGYAGLNYIYKADCDNPLYSETKWKPSIHMPRNASRILLEITDVHPKREQFFGNAIPWVWVIEFKDISDAVHPH